MRRVGAVLVMVGLLMAGCTGDPSEPGPTGKPTRRPSEVDGIPTSAGTHKLKMDVPGPGHREYRLRVPPGLEKSAKPLPLVLAIHGGASNADAFERLTGFNEIADEENVLVAYPEGFVLSWNAGGCCGPAKLGNVDDVGFLTKLIEKLVDAGVADPGRVFAAGFSNGGGMAYRMACEGPGRLKAIGVVSAALIMECAPSRPVSAMIVHGTADRSVPYNGGGKRDFNDDRPFPPFQKAVDFWLKQDRLGPLRDDGKCRSSKGETTVRVCTIKGGTHRWPDGAARDLWEFFSSQ